MRTIGLVTFVIQFASMCLYSAFEYKRFSVAFDFGLFYQAWYLIAHGVLNPYSTMHGFYYWQNHFELIMWPLALLYYIFPHGIVLLWLQNAGTSITSFLAYLWFCAIIRKRTSVLETKHYVLVLFLLALLILNPWNYWSNAYDFHFQSISSAFMMATAMSYYFNRRKLTWLFAILTLSTGDLGGLYVFSIGFAYVIRKNKPELQSLGLMVLGVGWLLLVHKIGGARGSQVSNLYGYLGVSSGASQSGITAVLMGVATHPLVVVEHLWAQRLNLYSNISPAGILGIFTPIGFSVSLVTLVVNALAGTLWIAPSFQSVPAYPFISLGTVLFLMKIKYKKLQYIVVSILFANSLGWAVVWLPHQFSRWIDVSASTARTLHTVKSIIPKEADLIVSQGIVGRFSNRYKVSAFYKYLGYLTEGPQPLYILLAPYQGIEVAGAATTLQQIEVLSRERVVHLVYHSNNIWLFKLPAEKQRSIRRVYLGTPPTMVSGWSLKSNIGEISMQGQVENWSMASRSGNKGYLIHSAYWRLAPGSYFATITYRSTQPINFEVWNTTGNRLLLRRTIMPSTKRVTDTFQFADITAFPLHLFWGWGPFQMDSIDTESYDQIEIRAWVPGTGNSNVYNVGVTGAVHGK